jgi:plasmid stabilization system protein ParE
MARGIGSYTLSRKADADVQDIAEESVKRWGLARAEQYILALHEAFERLAKFPNLDGTPVKFVPAICAWRAAVIRYSTGKQRAAS